MTGLTASPNNEALPHVSLASLRVRLDRAVDRREPCHDNMAVVSADRLVCTTCGRDRGSLAKPIAAFLTETIALFGPLQADPVIRDNGVVS
jgi:hypothetical protein